MIPLGVLASARVAAAGGATYYDEVMADSPAIYWRLGESSGDATDHSGNGRSGTAVGGSRGVSGLLTGDSDLAFGFPGYVYRGNEPWMNSLSGWSIELIGTVTNPGSANTSGGIAAGWLNGGTARYGFYRYNGRLYVAPAGEQGFYNVAGMWDRSHWVMTATTGRWRLYRNGSLVKDVAFTYSAPPDGSTFSCGALYHAGSAQFAANGRGTIDEVAVYTSALSAAQVLAHAQAAGVA